MEQDVAGTVGQVVTAPTQPATRVTRTRTAAPAKRAGTPRTGTPNGHGSGAGGADLASVSVVLPKDCYDYFAAEAEKDERTLAQFLRRTLRDVWQRQVAAWRTAGATGTKPATAGDEMYAAVEGANGPEFIRVP